MNWYTNVLGFNFFFAHLTGGSKAKSIELYEYIKINWRMYACFAELHRFVSTILFSRRFVMKASQIAMLVNGSLIGDPDIVVLKPSKIEEGEPGSICFLGNIKYEPYLYTTKASLVIVDESFEPREKVSCTLLKVPNVYEAVAKLLAFFETTDSIQNTGIDDLASIHSSAKLGKGVSVGAFSIISEEVEIADGVTIYPQVYIGAKVKIGTGTVLFPGARILKDSIIGQRCVIQSNTVIGSDGFGYAPDKEGVYSKIAQIGNVVLEDDVEIGANTCIDRGSIGSTIIKKGSKLDNLIQIAHNVQVGQHTVIAAQAGIAGSAKIGNHVILGGQVGVAGHLGVADYTMVQAQSGIASSIEKMKGKWYGSPAIDYYSYLRAYSEFKKLPDLRKQVDELRKQLDELKSGK